MGDYIPNIVRTLQEEKEWIEKAQERGQKKKAVEIAKKILAYGMSLEEVIEITGLSKEDVEGLEF